MLSRFRPTLRALAVTGLLLVTGALAAPAGAQSASIQPRVYTPLVMTGGTSSIPTPPATIPSDWLGRLNYYRALAGLPAVAEDAALSANCTDHARYMAENNHLTHSQDAGRPFASPAGQVCARNSNVWIGGGTAWEPANSIDSWMGSVGHRLWMLYPTTPAFGYAFSTAVGREAAAMDVLSRANYGADAAYTGWPVRYPAAGQVAVPATRYPVTLLWPYFGAAPQLAATSLRTESGVAVAHTADSNLPGGHKGVQIVPDAALPDNTVFVVEVSGSYSGAPFSLSWRFSTGDATITAKSAEAAVIEAVPAALEVVEPVMLVEAPVSDE